MLAHQSALIVAPSVESAATKPGYDVATLSASSITVEPEALFRDHQVVCDLLERRRENPGVVFLEQSSERDRAQHVARAGLEPAERTAQAKPARLCSRLYCHSTLIRISLAR
jgi:hypothetical protein